MYCSNCGTMNSANASFCKNCGQSIEHEATPLKPVTVDTHLKKGAATTEKDGNSLVTWGWILMIASIFSGLFGTAVAMLLSASILIISIALLVSQSPRKKRHGKILISIWLVTFTISFITSFNTAQNTQTTQQPGYTQTN